MLLICIKENRISNLGTYMVLCNIIHYVVQTDFTSPEFYILITTITETTSISSDSHLWLHGLVEQLPLLGCNLVNHTVHLQPHHCNYCVCLHNSLLHDLDTMTGSVYPICPTSAASQRAPRSPSVAPAMDIVLSCIYRSHSDSPSVIILLAILSAFSAVISSSWPGPFSVMLL